MKDKDIVIKRKDLTPLVTEGGKLVFNKKAEVAIVALLDHYREVGEAIDSLKKTIAEAGQSISPDFKGVVGEKVKAVYRLYGDRYEYDKSRKEELMPFLKLINWYKLSPEKVDEYVEQTGTVPDGIILKEREPVISLTLVKPALEE